MRKRGREINSSLDSPSVPDESGDLSPAAEDEGALGVTRTTPLIENVKAFLLGGRKSLIFRCNVIGKDGRGASDSDCTIEGDLVGSLVSLSAIVLKTDDKPASEPGVVGALSKE
jgi:hypothetical protein